MTLKGYHFDRETVSPLADARLFDLLFSGRSCVLPGIAGGCAVSMSGLDATIGTGLAIIRGRLIEVTAPEEIAIPPNATGYIVLTVDLSQINTSTGDVGTDLYTVENNQVRAEFVVDPIQDHINNGGAIFNLVLGKIVSSLTTAVYTKNTASYTRGSNIVPYARINYTVAYSISTTDPAALPLSNFQTSDDELFEYAAGGAVICNFDGAVEALANIYVGSGMTANANLFCRIKKNGVEAISTINASPGTANAVNVETIIDVQKGDALTMSANVSTGAGSVSEPVAARTFLHVLALTVKA